MNKTRKLALSALIAALAVVLCWIGAIVPTGSVAFVGFAGLLTAIAVVECGYAWALGQFAVACVLGLLLVSDKMIVLIYAALFGWYPVVKSLIDRSKLRVAAQWIIKLLILNAVLVLGYMAANKLLLLEDTQTLPVLLVGVIPVEVSFVFYDLVLTKLIDQYTRRKAKKK
ncbi:MAG: hypothetical protein LBT88_05620 [Oscillospiraceae bacterium]|jgi:predicted membrane protein|nr:hypothetical protein [Oscillospiraceae bacterium]